MIVLLKLDLIWVELIETQRDQEKKINMLASVLISMSHKDMNYFYQEVFTYLKITC